MAGTQSAVRALSLNAVQNTRGASRNEYAHDATLASNGQNVDARGGFTDMPHVMGVGAAGLSGSPWSRSPELGLLEPRAPDATGGERWPVVEGNDAS